MRLNLEYMRLRNPDTALQWEPRWRTPHDHHFVLRFDVGRLARVEDEVALITRWCWVEFGRRGGATRAWNYRRSWPVQFVFRDCASAFAFRTRWDGETFR